MWSLQQVTLTLSVGSLVLLIYYVRNTVLVCSRALREFRQRSRGLPVLEEGWSLLANHGLELHLGRNVCHKITRWHSKYGKTFGWLYGERFCASTIDLDLIKLFAHDEQREHINRMPFKSVMRVFEEDNLFLAEDEQWRRLRRMFGPALKKYKTPNMVAEIETAVNSFVQHLDDELTTKRHGELVINANKQVHRFSLDVVLRCFYKQPGLIEYKQAANYWVDVLDEALESPIATPWLIRAALAFPALVMPLDFIMRHCTKVGEWFNLVHGFITDQTKSSLEARRQLIAQQGLRVPEDDATTAQQLVVENFRLADGSEFKRFVVDYIIDSFLDGKCTRSEYSNSSFFILNAADKTVADALTHALYFLAVEAECQQKLRQSLLNEGLDSTYLTWTINETLRLHPPAAIGCSRTVERDIDLADGTRVPRGSYIITPLNTIHRLPEYWGEDAHEFRPERWRDTSHHHPMQFLPFGAGLRVCPGRELAMFEMKKLLLAAVSKFQFECQPKPDINTFDSPYMLYTLPNSPTLIRVTRVASNDVAGDNDHQQQ